MAKRIHLFCSLNTNVFQNDRLISVHLSLMCNEKNQIDSVYITRLKINVVKSSQPDQNMVPPLTKNSDVLSFRQVFGKCIESGLFNK